MRCFDSGVLLKLSVSTLCRSLDILQVAMAMVLGASEFCTFDVRQARMAKASGISVIP
jgi:predicted nucleic acid-binding protein